MLFPFSFSFLSIIVMSAGFRSFRHYRLRRVWYIFLVSLHSNILWEVPQIHLQINTWSLAANSPQALLKHSVDSKMGKAGEKMLRITYSRLCPGNFCWELLRGREWRSLPSTLRKLTAFLFFISLEEHKRSWTVCGLYNGHLFPLKKCIQVCMINFFLWRVTYTRLRAFSLETQYVLS